MWNILGETIIEDLRSIKNGIIKDLNKMATVFQMMIPVIVCYMSRSLLEAIVMSISYYLMCAFIRQIWRKANGLNKYDFPISGTRYTEENEMGVYISVGKMEEAIQYLSDVEDFVESKGWK